MASLETAIELHQSGRIDEAEQAYRQILAAEPSQPGALNLLGVIRQQQGRHEDALELVGRAIALNPNAAVYHNNYGAALLSLNRHAEARVSFQRALAIRPNYADALANLGMAQSALGQDEAALASFRSALDFQPGHPDAVKRLAGLFQKLGRGEEAVGVYEQALADRPSAELRTQFRGLTVLTRRWDDRCPAAAADRLLFDGMRYYRYDKRGNRTSCYQKDPQGNPVDVTTYQWNDGNELIAIVEGGAKVDYACDSLEGSAPPIPTDLFTDQEQRRLQDAFGRIGGQIGSAAPPDLAALAQTATRLPDSHGRSVRPISGIERRGAGCQPAGNEASYQPARNSTDWQSAARFGRCAGFQRRGDRRSRDPLRRRANVPGMGTRGGRRRLHRPELRLAENLGRSGTGESAQFAATTTAASAPRETWRSMRPADEWSRISTRTTSIIPITWLPLLKSADEADVLVFGYDFVYEDGPAGDRPPSWDPGPAGSLSSRQTLSRRWAWPIAAICGKRWADSTRPGARKTRIFGVGWRAPGRNSPSCP